MKNIIKRRFAGKPFGVVLAGGLMPAPAWASDDYPDVNERVYVGPETQTTIFPVRPVTWPAPHSV